MRHPDRRQAEHVGEAVVGQRAAEIRAGSPAARRSSRRSTRWPNAPTDDPDRVASPPSARCPRARTSTCANPARIEMRANRRDERAPVAAGDEAHLQMRAVARGGIAFTGRSGLPVRNASTSSVFQPNTRSAGDSPGSPQSASIAGPSGSPGSIVASARRTDSGIGSGTQRRHEDAPARIDQRCDGVARGSCRDWRGVRPSCRNDARLRGATPTRSKLNAPREPRKIVGRSETSRGPSEAISTSAASSRACVSHTSRSPGEPTSSPISSSSFALKPRRPRASSHTRQRGEVDRVLTLVVGGAAPVPAPTVDRDVPRRAPFAPLAVVSGDHVAMAVDQHGRQRGVLASFGEQHRRRAGDRIRPQLPIETESRDRRRRSRRAGSARVRARARGSCFPCEPQRDGCSSASKPPASNQRAARSSAAARAALTSAIP